ncbi:helix-turn-helix domain-containing protein [Maricaulis salignorans]|uniref:AraC-type DNA-binding protein n=1 Tax=Maricaulis salignorans TaxID=144026 RepID=A0A1G9MUR4_9PROT|nr:AraC family transcriptional regulator [Maricaulis salignorans]SDL78000.1 AraC-type DNA-binding protein [Maricaulis salignorans]
MPGIQNKTAITRFRACIGHTAFSPHRHDVYTLGLTTRGVQCFNYRGAARQSLAGELVVLHPDELHDGHAGTSEGFAYRALTIRPSAIGDILPAQALPFIEGGQSDNPALKQAVSTVLADLDEPLDPLRAADGLFDIAIALHGAAGHTPSGSELDARATERARSYIHDHLDEAVSMDDLEQVAGQDRWQLSRDFRRLHGTSPYRYLVMRRLDAARERIHRGECIAQTALACGFNDQSHMTRHFKAAHGLSPFRWKRSVTQGAAIGRTIVQD